MKRLVLGILIASLTGCAAYKPKTTTFYDQSGKVVKSFNGRGIWDGDENLGLYKVWAMDNNSYYEYSCRRCTYVETLIPEKK